MHFALVPPHSIVSIFYSMKKAILLGLLVLIAAGGYWYYRSIAEGPKYSLMQAAAAVQSHDVAAFERYVDVGSITGSVVDQVAGQRSALKLLSPGSMAFTGALHLLKPQLAEAARKEVRRYVETGSVEAAVAAQPNRAVNVSLLGLVGKVVGTDSQFKDVKYVKEVGDQEALVGVELMRPRYDTTLVVELKMHKRPGNWQVTEITNTGELIRQVARLEKQRMVK